MSVRAHTLGIRRDYDLVLDVREFLRVLDCVHQTAVLRLVLWRLWAQLDHHNSDLQFCTSSVGYNFIDVVGTTLSDFERCVLHQRGQLLELSFLGLDFQVELPQLFELDHELGWQALFHFLGNLLLYDVHH